MSRRFIEFLDSYDKTTKYDNLDNALLRILIQNDFKESKFGDEQFSGNRPEVKLTASVIDISQNYYTNYYSSIWNKSNELRHQTPYFIWQQEHEINVNALPSVLYKKPKSKTLCIDISMQSLSDMISIIDTHKYDEDVEYNINLKSLHNIKVELEQLNSMIGMESMKKSVLEQLIYFVQELHIGKENCRDRFFGNL